MEEGKKKRGRPPGTRKYPDVPPSLGGAPVFGVRLEPELYEWVKAQGGARWLRELILRERAKGAE